MKEAILSEFRIDTFIENKEKITKLSEEQRSPKFKPITTHGVGNVRS